jgi:hypothetical protein
LTCCLSLAHPGWYLHFLVGEERLVGDRHAQFEFVAWGGIGVGTTEDRPSDTIELRRTDYRTGSCAANCCAKHDLMDSEEQDGWRREKLVD